MTFKAYLKIIEAKVLNTTNCWEKERFVTNNGVVCVVYEGKRGIKFSNETAKEIYKDWKGAKAKNIRPKDELKPQKRKLRKLLKSFKDEQKQGVYKFICDEMGYKTLSFVKISNIEELRDICRLITQYKQIFINQN